MPRMSPFPINTLTTKCKNLKKIEFGKNITSIGGECFKDCESLEEAEFPAGVSELRGEAFMGCSALRSIVLPLSITEIRGNTFEECTSLEVVEIPAGVTRIAAHAFYGCSSLRDVFVPDTVKEIGSSAFRRCPELKEIELPDGVSVNERAFKESPTRILEKKISDAMFEDIVDEVNSKSDPESVYVLYEKSNGSEEAYIENNSVFIADDIRFNDVMDEQYALKEFKDAEALQKYL
ncbi:MAG: leucine-rich repeat domain-containing protein, partial [Clostridia bacterium]|nr:leucine-rich repeat domain-containing protein [Clostridia bacterium]